MQFFNEKLDEGCRVVLCGQVLSIEEKGEKTYLFLTHVECANGDESKESLKNDSGEGTEKGAADGEGKLSDGGEDKSNNEEGTGDEQGTESVSFRKVLLTADQSKLSALMLRPGVTIRADAECTGFRIARNDGNYDEKSYYHSLGVEEKFRLKGDLKITDSSYDPLRTALQWVRGKLLQTITELAGSEMTASGSGEEGKESRAAWSDKDSVETGDSAHAGIFAAIITGDRSGLDPETKEMYQKSGIAHILAISGLHISLLGMTLFSMFRKKMRFTFAALLSGILMIFFCIMSGESASAVRASLMFLLRLLAMKTGKTFDLLSALGFSAICLLLHNPMILYHSGFLMSFGAILGIGLLAPAIESYLKENRYLFKALPDFIEEQGLFRMIFGGADLKAKFFSALIASASVTLFTLPVIMNSYFQVPLLSVFFNLLVVPLMGLILQSGVFGALLGIISIFIGRFIIGIGVYLVSLIELFCALMDKIPFSIIITGYMPAYRIFLYYGILAGFLLMAAHRRKQTRLLIREPTNYRFRKAGRILRNFSRIFTKKNRRQRKRLAVAGFFLLAILMIVFFHPVPSNLMLTFFDVDQGESILIESPGGGVFLIDGGSSSVTDLYRYRLKSALKYRGISKIDRIIITHPDTDHISGILSILNESGADSIRVKALMVPEVSGNEKYEELLKAAEKAGVAYETLKAGMLIEDGRISLKCLHPDDDYYSNSANGYSAVLDLKYGSFRALFTGDLEEDGEKILLHKNKLADYDLLKVAHHGSKYSSTAEFLEAVSPENAIISAGINNRYGHPHKEVLERLKALGCRIFVTNEHGEIFVSAFEDGRLEIRTKI